MTDPAPEAALVPSSIKQDIKPYAKSVVATLGLIASAVAIWAPGAADTVQAVVQQVIAVAVAFGVYQIPNKHA